MKIYHGSWNCFEQFDFGVANHFSTNGAAFYASTVPAIARNYAYREAKRHRSKPYLYCYEIDDSCRESIIINGNEVIITDSSFFTKKVVLVSRIILERSFKNLIWRFEDSILEIIKHITIRDYGKRMAWRKRVNSTLYHGTNEIFDNVSLEQCLPIGYLGKGFYGSTSRLEAIFYSIARSKQNGGTPYLYSFYFTGHPKFFDIQKVKEGIKGGEDCDISYTRRLLKTRLRSCVGSAEVAFKSEKAINNLILLRKIDVSKDKYWNLYLKLYSVINIFHSISLRESIKEVNIVKVRIDEMSSIYESPIINFMVFKTENGFALSTSYSSGNGSNWD